MAPCGRPVPSPLPGAFAAAHPSKAPLRPLPCRYIIVCRSGGPHQVLCGRSPPLIWNMAYKKAMEWMIRVCKSVRYPVSDAEQWPHAAS